MDLWTRDTIPFPDGSTGNSSDTVLDGVHFNLTTLYEFNYTLYTNGTLSNGSKCYLAIEPWTPDYLFVNGSFVNSTSCYSPIDPIRARAAVGVGIGVVFGIMLIGVLMNLAKHGKLHLPAEKRFVPVGRRWQWYWSIWVIVTAFVSLFTNIDVDRFRVMGLPLILNSFFWFLMQQGALALVWEAVRHWGSWQERQYIDPDPFILPDDDRRSKLEFFVPLFFYLFLWMNFFLVVPRNWNLISQQRSPEQTIEKAVPAATDARFKAAAFILLVAWLVIFFSLRHSIKHYKPRNRGIINRSIGFWKYTPLRFKFIMPLSLVIVAYQILVSFSFPNSVLNAKGNLGAIYAGGYGPSLLILIVQIIWGFKTPNEDLQLKDQRRRRGDDADRSLGFVRKPAWWRRVKDAAKPSTSNMGGGRATAQGVQTNFDNHDNEAGAPDLYGSRREATMELVGLPKTAPSSSAKRVGPQTTVQGYGGKSNRRRHERAFNSAADLLFPQGEGQTAANRAKAERRAQLMQDGPAPPPYDPTAQASRQRQSSGVGSASSANAPPDFPAVEGSGTRPESSRRSQTGSTSTSTQGQPQRIKSMLDV